MPSTYTWPRKGLHSLARASPCACHQGALITNIANLLENNARNAVRCNRRPDGSLRTPLTLIIRTCTDTITRGTFPLFFAADAAPVRAHLRGWARLPTTFYWSQAQTTPTTLNPNKTCALTMQWSCDGSGASGGRSASVPMISLFILFDVICVR